MMHLPHVITLCLGLPLLSASAREIARDTTATDTPSVQELFPKGNLPLKSWSMSTQVPGHFSMSPEAFNIPSGLGPADPLTIVNGPDGAPSPAIEATYGAGKYGDGSGSGFSFYALGPEQVNLTTAKEVTFSYSVYFEKGFDFVLGGTLPGLYGGDTYDLALSCPDTVHDKIDTCFSTAPVWLIAEDSMLLAHLPFSGKAANDQALCHLPPACVCPPEADPRAYGLGMTAFKFAAGQRTTLGQRVRLNDAGQANGQIELYVNGTSMFLADKVVVRTHDEGRIWGLQMRTSFGAIIYPAQYLDKKSASPKEQHAYFGDFSVAITQDL
ncbi:hypothetical protein C8T65DRAFT_744143 [Cerioporus squamosus]|nr:hypothetical protein C8T65DRAFT_744143 [Cerioporus squamosus]